MDKIFALLVLILIIPQSMAAGCFDVCETDYHRCAGDRVQVPEVCVGSRKICVERCDPAARSLKALSHRQSGPSAAPASRPKATAKQACFARCDNLAFNCTETNGQGQLCDNTRRSCIEPCD